MSFPIKTNPPDPRTNTDFRAKNTNRVISDGNDAATSATVNNPLSDRAVITHANRGLAAGEGRILDADLASETANLTRASTLLQTGPAAMAQANLAPRAVLSLLKG